MRKYRAGIIGLGRMGSTIDDEFPGAPFLPYSVAAACRAHPKIELVAGADIDPERRRAFAERWGVKAVYEDFQEMLAKEDLDLVAVTTRGDTHASIAAVAATAVPMLYCEKAIACSMAEADALLQACRESGTKFNSGTLKRFHPRYRQARELVLSGAVGEPLAAVYWARRSPLMHMHIHSIDAIMFMLGDPKIRRVRGTLRGDVRFAGHRLDQDPDALYQIEFENGVLAQVVPAGALDYEIAGTQGAVRVENNGAAVRLRRQDENSPVRWPVWTERPVPFVDAGSGTLAALNDLIEAYEQDRPTANPIELAHRATEACLAVAESHRLGGVWMDLPLANRDLYVWHV